MKPRMRMISKKIVFVLLRLWRGDPWRKYVDAEVIDFSGQGRDKYGF